MNTALWIVQILLGTLMLSLGLMKTFQPVEKLKRFKWTSNREKGFIRFVGISELLIGTGLLLPWITGILPMLTSLAAVSLCVIMVLAVAEHMKEKEFNDIGKNAIIFLLAAFVAIGRFVPFQ